MKMIRLAIAAILVPTLVAIARMEMSRVAPASPSHCGTTARKK